jgi:hypothetical protein
LNDTRIKYISFAKLSPLEKNYQYPADVDARTVYIADTGNHCIRRLVISKAHVDTFAGICGSPGFKDGPFGINQLKNPEMVGIDDNGIVFIYDAGNNYIRMVNADGYMKTLI